MKLIDADALEEAIMMTGAVKVKDEETAYEFAGILANAPAVDAIPVEWLREQMNKCDDNDDIEGAAAISWLIQTWHKEHPVVIHPTWYEWMAEKGIDPDDPIPADVAEKLGIGPKEG